MLGQYPTGVCVVTARSPDGTPVGLSVGSFTSLSLDPPLVAFMPDAASTTWPKIRAAGTFCVNILSAEQEHLCRTFASKRPDRFEGVRWSPAGTGSPIIEGVVAWIDCELERVEDGGDHDIVIGRVRALDTVDASLPLLFFRGGYGRFEPLSLVARGHDLLEQLVLVDLIRPEIDRVAGALDGEVTAAALVGGDVALLASAGTPEATTAMPPIVGQRIPAFPPVGSLIMAWADPPEVDAWLRPVGSDQERATWQVRLEQVRRRGYSVKLEDEAGTRLAHLIHHRRISADHRPDELKDLMTRVPLDPLDFTVEQATQVRAIYAPVFAPDGHVAIALGVAMNSLPSDAAELERRVGTLLRSARAATALISGVDPSTAP